MEYTVEEYKKCNYILVLNSTFGNVINEPCILRPMKHNSNYRIGYWKVKSLKKQNEK